MVLLEAEGEMGDFLARPAVRPLPRSLQPGALVGRYEIVRIVGAGGSGTVYESMQLSPHRKVALKVMHAGLPSADALRRFEEEAEILARLKHPGIATVYEAGVHEGLPYFALEYVDGARTIVDHAQSLDRKRRLLLFAEVCDAVHHGHLKGIVHRDLKPGNVLVDETGRAKIIDFGIARTRDGEDVAPRVEGTLPYMSPEQCALGHDVDARTDVYALGVLLYELLSGRLPLDPTDTPLAEAVRMIREAPPAPLLHVHGDLAAITRKALAKEPEARYASAAALGDDVRRHLTHRPVEARPHDVLYQWRKFARRQRFGVAAIAVIVVGAVVAAVVNRRLANERERERAAAQYHAYLADIAAATAAIRENDVANARLHLDRAPAAHHGWEWRHLRGRLDLSESVVAVPGAMFDAGAASPDGSLLAAASRGTGPHNVMVFDAATGEMRYGIEVRGQRAESLAFSPDGARLVVGRISGGVDLHDARTGALLRATDDHTSQVTMIAFEPGGGRFATSSYDGTVKLRDTDGHVLDTLALEGGAFSVAFDPVRPRLAAGGRDGRILLWDLGTGGVRTVRAHASNVEDIAFSPDGRRLVSVSMDKSVKVWDAESREPIDAREAHTAGVKSVVFARDGSFVTAGTDRTLRVWSLDASHELVCLRGHEHYVYSLALTGGRVVSFSLDGTIRSWDPGARDVPALRVQADTSVVAMGLDRDGRLASLDSHGTFRAWDVASGDLVASAAVGLGEARSVAETWYAIRGQYASSLLLVPAASRLPEVAPYCAATGEGNLFAGGPGVPVRVSRLSSGEWVEGARGPEDVRDLVASPGGRFVAGREGDGTIHVWRADTLDRTAELKGPGDRLARIAVDAEGRRVACAGYESGLHLYDRGTKATLSRERGMFTALAFSPDGERLATTGMDGALRLWDTGTGEVVLVLKAHALQATALAWSADGRRLATAGDGWSAGVTIFVWEAP